MQTDDARENDVLPLITPRDLKGRFPLPDKVRATVAAGRAQLQDALSRPQSDRLIVIVGPCSIHDADAALDYAKRLKCVVDTTRKELLIVMRTYFEKPRTVLGWKGLVSDPRLDGSGDIEAGLTLARSVLLRIGELGLLCGTEFLDPITPNYLSDLVAWAAVGARTTESQTHRQMASGLGMPVGFKNSTDGALQNALNAMLSAREGHMFPGINADGLTAIVRTNGNPAGHIVLRGGGGRCNYHPSDIDRAVRLVRGHGIERGVVVDCSHDNSGKDYTRQASVLGDVLESYTRGQRGILGVMIESNLHPGSQTWARDKVLQYGVSITDSCIGWEETERLLYHAAERIAGMRSAA